MPHVHVIGAGLAGLAAALSLTAAGRTVTLHEAAGFAGGRCRSYFDKELELKIDNGNHMLLSGNKDAAAFIDEIGARDQFGGPDKCIIPFVDIKTAEYWEVRPNDGLIPWWVLRKKTRIPETRLSDYLQMRKIAKIKSDIVLGESMRRGRLFWRLVEPFAVAALNTRPQDAMARMFGAVMRETLMLGGSACIPRLAKDGLSDALIDPALRLLEQRGAEIKFGSRISTFRMTGERLTSFWTHDQEVVLAPDDAVVLAVPPWIAADLIPNLSVPTEFEGILNIHYKYVPEPDSRLSKTGFLGIQFGTAEWLFQKPGHVSVTVSAANKWMDDHADTLGARIWPNIVAALRLGLDHEQAVPKFRVVKERRATFKATPAQDRRRPPAATPIGNLVLAGDWVQTGLPATIEGAIRSGRTAAKVLLGK